MDPLHAALGDASPETTNDTASDLSPTTETDSSQRTTSRVTPESEWIRLFHAENHAETIKEMGLKGLLRSGMAFRSVCWRIFLGCLPEKRSDWASKVKESRQAYEVLKKKYVEEPLKKMESTDLSLSVNNPLSQDTNSPWNLYFQDGNLKKEILQDVDRTFPEFEFFRDPSVRDMQLNILFCYAKGHEKLLYRQGMHELLAPILFVLDSDKRIPGEAGSTYPANEMDEIMNAFYVEHDAYFLFNALMESCEVWYLQKTELGISVKSTSDDALFVDSEAEYKKWMKESSPLSRKLDRVQNKLLSQLDPSLHSHLDSLGIAPQVYGIRWVRLLFGREFPLDDLLIVWDAIFAYSPSLSLIDYLCVAMLRFIRNALLGFDYSSCMQQLMHYPAVGDTHYLVEEALHLRNPKKYAKPPSWQYTAVANASPIMQRKVRRVDAVNKAIAQKVARPVVNAARHLIPKRSPVERPAPPQKKISSSKQPKAKPSLDLSDSATTTTTTNKDLEAKVEGLELLAQYCGGKMETYLNLIQEEFLKLDLERSQEDSIFLALAGLKQVRDLLKGTLKLSGTIAEMESQFDVLSPVKGKISSPMTDPFGAWKLARSNSNVSPDVIPPVATQLDFDAKEISEGDKKEESDGAKLLEPPSNGDRSGLHSPESDQTTSSFVAVEGTSEKEEGSLDGGEMFVFVDPLREFQNEK